MHPNAPTIETGNMLCVWMRKKSFLCQKSMRNMDGNHMKNNCICAESHYRYSVADGICRRRRHRLILLQYALIFLSVTHTCVLCTYTSTKAHRFDTCKDCHMCGTVSNTHAVHSHLHTHLIDGYITSVDFLNGQHWVAISVWLICLNGGLKRKEHWHTDTHAYMAHWLRSICGFNCRFDKRERKENRMHSWALQIRSERDK